MSNCDDISLLYYIKPFLYYDKLECDFGFSGSNPSGKKPDTGSNLLIFLIRIQIFNPDREIYSAVYCITF